MYRGLARLVAAIPGGLLQTNIVGCALFAAISGSSVVTAASIGRVALPELLRRGYDRPMAAGSLAAGGTLGILLFITESETGTILQARLPVPGRALLARSRASSG